MEAFIGNQEIVQCEGVFDLFDSLYYAQEITELDLSNSGITGSISQNIGNFTNLVSLNLSQNEITGPIPAEIGNLFNLKELKLFVNSLNGILPSSISNLINLEYFNVFNNQISGRIPMQIGNMAELKNFYIHQNLFYDTIPAELFELSNLVHLYLNDNDLVVDIGSNDGSLLKHFKSKGLKTIGVEPTNISKIANENGITTIQSFFNEDILII